MSRHRDVRGMDLGAERQAVDEDYEYGGDDALSPEDEMQMIHGLEAVREVVGSVKESGIPDSAIRDALWEYYFDVAQTIDWVYEEQGRLATKQKAAKEKAAAQKAASGPKTPTKKTAAPVQKTPTSTKKAPAQSQKDLDVAGLNLGDKEEETEANVEVPKVAIAREKLLEQVASTLASQQKESPAISLVVIGHVDAGKSTLMGRLLYELGRVEEKKKLANERASEKMGKSSFSWAWELDGTQEERERGITMDIAVQSFTTPHRHITILDAPGHREFIPNMISGASQADCALLVVDASTGEFEAGFERNGQTREHLVLVRSLGVSQVVVAVNKLDQVNWTQDRYEEICSSLTPFLVQSGFPLSKAKFIPVAAMEGVNLLQREGPASTLLNGWYNGSTLVDALDALEPPARNISAPLRLPISNVFKGQGAGIAVSGRICGGVVQVGERLRILPGDEFGVIKSISYEEDTVPWAADGSNVTLNLVNVDPIHLDIGSVLCPADSLVPLVTVFRARVIVFDIQLPITAGTSVELFHQSRDVPAALSKLVATIDRSNGKVIKEKPRVLTKGMSADVEITLRVSGMSDPNAKARPLPLETFSANKDMGRILIRRGGETIAAGIVLEIAE